jgi:hypothetical protein
VRFSLLLLTLVACSNDGSAPKTGSAGSAQGSSASTKRGSAGGFSASLSADLANDGSGSSSEPPGSNAKAGSAVASKEPKGPDVKVGSASVKAGSDAKAGSAVASMEPKGPDVKAGSAVATDAKAGSATKIDPKPNAGSVAAPEHHGPVKPSADLAAIKMDLLPNWERDLDEAGTIALSVKVRATGEMRTFTFHYGFDDARAPADRDAYVKFLGESKLLEVKLNRQRGAAWYLEGVDSSGRSAFRYLINYGGKHLVCFGTLYKDAAGNALGDLRDNVIVQAKQICETLSL